MDDPPNLTLVSNRMETGWTGAERQHLISLRRCLAERYPELDWNEGITDRGEPWVVAVNAQTDELVVHITRVGVRYVVLNDRLQMIINAPTLHHAADAYLDRQSAAEAADRSHLRAVTVHPGTSIAAFALLLIDMLRDVSEQTAETDLLSFNDELLSESDRKATGRGADIGPQRGGQRLEMHRKQSGDVAPLERTNTLLHDRDGVAVPTLAGAGAMGLFNLVAVLAATEAAANPADTSSEGEDSSDTLLLNVNMGGEAADGRNGIEVRIGAGSVNGSDQNRQAAEDSATLAFRSDAAGSEAASSEMSTELAAAFRGLSAPQTGFPSKAGESRSETYDVTTELGGSSLPTSGDEPLAGAGDSSDAGSEARDRLEEDRSDSTAVECASQDVSIICLSTEMAQTQFPYHELNTVDLPWYTPPDTPDPWEQLDVLYDEMAELDRAFAVLFYGAPDDDVFFEFIEHGFSIQAAEAATDAAWDAWEDDLMNLERAWGDLNESIVEVEDKLLELELAELSTDSFDWLETGAEEALIELLNLG
ncbi:MAG: hypothetical protein AAGJ28_08655 [Pseudomonadota bacterium]